MNAAMVARTLTAVSTTCAELGIAPGQVVQLDYDPPTLGSIARVRLVLDDGREVRITKQANGCREFHWIPADLKPEPSIPELARVELDAVRERLAEVYAVRRPGVAPIILRHGQSVESGVHECTINGHTVPEAVMHAVRATLAQQAQQIEALKAERSLDEMLAAPVPGEPTGHVVVKTARDIPESIAGHAMFHHGPGVMRHARLGIFVIVLDEIDPEKRGRQALQALGDLGLARERLAKVERERDELRDELDGQRAIVEDLQHQRDQARAEIESLRATVTVVQQERDPVHAQARGEIERLTAKVGERGRRLGERCQELDAARADAERLRGLLAETLDAILGHCGEDHGTPGCPLELADRIRREAGLT